MENLGTNAKILTVHINFRGTGYPLSLQFFEFGQSVQQIHGLITLVDKDDGTVFFSIQGLEHALKGFIRVIGQSSQHIIVHQGRIDAGQHGFAGFPITF